MSRPEATQTNKQSVSGVRVPNRLGEALSDPHSPQVLHALSRRCDLCGAPIGDLCAKRHGIRDDLAGRIIHIGRLHPADPRKATR